MIDSQYKIENSLRPKSFAESQDRESSLVKIHCEEHAKSMKVKRSSVNLKGVDYPCCKFPTTEGVEAMGHRASKPSLDRLLITM